MSAACKSGVYRPRCSIKAPDELVSLGKSKGYALFSMLSAQKRRAVHKHPRHARKDAQAGVSCKMGRKARPSGRGLQGVIVIGWRILTRNLLICNRWADNCNNVKEEQSNGLPNRKHSADVDKVQNECDQTNRNVHFADRLQLAGVKYIHTKMIAEAAQGCVENNNRSNPHWRFCNVWNVHMAGATHEEAHDGMHQEEPDASPERCSNLN